VLIDTAAGISKSVLAFCLAATTISVGTPDPAAITDVYMLMKAMVLQKYKAE
jgi:MinD-like ATPase involved in chromosome partitioning or flagellar assembly